MAIKKYKYPGGKGKKAPYLSSTLRCPNPCYSVVKNYIEIYKDFSLSSPELPGSFLLSEILEILEESLKLPANKGGAIKKEVKKAIELVEMLLKEN